MTKNLSVLFWIPLMFTALFVAYWVVCFSQAVIELEEYILRKQVNYSIDSAMIEMTENSDTDLDYADGEYVMLEPQFAVDDFAHSMCLNFDLLPTQENLEYVLNKFTRTFLVCTYDGVYCYWNKQTTSSDFELTHSPRIPYFYTSTDGVQYCLTLDPEKGYCDNGDSTNYRMSKYGKYDPAFKLSADVQSTAIAMQVERLANWCLADSYRLGNSDIAIEIPAVGASLRTGAISINKPTIMAVLEGRFKVYGTAPVAEVIGGAAVEEVEHCVGYTFTDVDVLDVDGNVVATLNGNYYARQNWYDIHEDWMRGLSTATLGTAKYFDNPFDAATDGYTDLSYID